MEILMSVVKRVEVQEEEEVQEEKEKVEEEVQEEEKVQEKEEEVQEAMEGMGMATLLEVEKSAKQNGSVLNMEEFADQMSYKSARK